MLFIAVCNELLVQGSSGSLVARESSVSAVALVDRYTVYTLPAGRTSFTLVSSSSATVSFQFTRFLIRVREVCSDGSALTVRVDYIINGALVCNL